MPRRQCHQCRDMFDARRSDAKFCSPRCRQQAFQHASRSDRTNSNEPAGSYRGLVTAVRAQLDELNASDTVDGMAALQMAEHLCRDTISGAERSSLTKTLAEVMQRVTASRTDPADPVEQIRARWRAKRAGAPVAASEFVVNGRILADGFPN